MWHTHTCVNNGLKMVTKLALGLLMLYNSFPRLIAGLIGCAYYWSHLTVVTVSPVCSHRGCLWAFQRNKRHPQIVAYSSRTKTSSKKNRSHSHLIEEIQYSRKTGVYSSTRLHCIRPSSCNMFFRLRVSVFANIVPSETLPTCRAHPWEVWQSICYVKRSWLQVGFN